MDTKCLVIFLMFFINNVFRYTFCLSFEYNKIESKADENTEEGNNVKDNSTVQLINYFLNQK